MAFRAVGCSALSHAKSGNTSRSLRVALMPPAGCFATAPTAFAAFASFTHRCVSTVNITFVDTDGDSETVKATVGESLLEAAHSNDIEIEGACGGECACSTCHVILPQALFDSLEEPEEEEEDMLDLALGLKDTSRLGCQVIVTDAFEGVEIMLPTEVNNMQG